MSDWATGDGTVVSGLPEPADVSRVANRLESRGTMYVPNFESFGRFILSDQVRKPVATVARAIAVTAGVYAPKDPLHSEGVPLAANFKVKVHAGVMVVDHAPRVMVEVYNDKRYAARIEFGAQREDRPGRNQMLARAGAAYGDFKGDSL